MFEGIENENRSNLFLINSSFLNQELTKEQAWYHFFKIIILQRIKIQHYFYLYFSLTLWMELTPNIDMRKLDCPLFETGEWWIKKFKVTLKERRGLYIKLCENLNVSPNPIRAMTCHQTSNIGPEWWDM